MFVRHTNEQSKGLSLNINGASKYDCRWNKLTLSNYQTFYLVPSNKNAFKMQTVDKISALKFSWASTAAKWLPSFVNSSINSFSIKGILPFEITSCTALVAVASGQHSFGVLPFSKSHAFVFDISRMAHIAWLRNFLCISGLMLLAITRLFPFKTYLDVGSSGLPANKADWALRQRVVNLLPDTTTAKRLKMRIVKTSP